MVSVAAGSQRWLILAAALASLTFLIKQSGLMLMGTLGLVWLVALAFQWRLSPADSPKRGYVIGGMVRFAVIYGVVLGLSMFSTYFSRANSAYAMKALGFYRDLAPTSRSRSFIGRQARWPLRGCWSPPPWSPTTSGRLLRDDRRTAALAIGLTCGSVVIWILGLWYWVVTRQAATRSECLSVHVDGRDLHDPRAARDVAANVGMGSRIVLAVCVAAAATSRCSSAPATPRPTNGSRPRGSACPSGITAKRSRTQGHSSLKSAPPARTRALFHAVHRRRPSCSSVRTRKPCIRTSRRLNR